MLKTVARVSIISAVFFFVVASFFGATALTTQSFPSCVNPQGSVKASYTSGTHGIVGDTRTFNGSDTVYTLTDSTLLQCFCPDNGQGIQTNWWKVPGITESEKNYYGALGWIYVPTGAPWGLEDTPYLAKNNSFVCGGGIGGGEVLGASTIGLAATGNTTYILRIAGIGLLSLSLAYLLKKVSKS